MVADASRRREIPVSDLTLDAAVSMEMARERPAVLGYALANLVTRPNYTNDDELEQQRSKEYNVLVVCCKAEAAAWNAEAKRWHVERARTVGLRTHAVACARWLSSIPASHGRVLLGDTDAVASDAGLCSARSELAELTELMDPTVAALSRWRLKHEERLRAALVLCSKQRRAFVVRWQRKLDSRMLPGVTPGCQLASDVLHVAARQIQSPISSTRASVDRTFI